MSLGIHPGKARCTVLEHDFASSCYCISCNATQGIELCQNPKPDPCSVSVWDFAERVRSGAGSHIFNDPRHQRPVPDGLCRVDTGLVLRNHEDIVGARDQKDCKSHSPQLPETVLTQYRL
jgi:hypothetical protein